MKHLNKKIAIQGSGGKKPKPQPAILNPPKLGGFKVLSSYSVAEIIDLISDGPIEGLVDKNGKLLSKDIFKGVYLDNTPIQNTEPEVNSVLGSLDVSSAVNSIGSIWSNGTTVRGYQYEAFRSRASAERLFLAKDEIIETFYEETSYPKFLSFSVSWRTAVPDFNDSITAVYGTPLDVPSFWELSDGKAEIHRLKDGAFAQTPSNKRIVQRFREYLNDLTRSDDKQTRNLALKNLKQIEELESFANDLTDIPLIKASNIGWTQQYFCNFVIEFNGNFGGELTGEPSGVPFFDEVSFALDSELFNVSGASVSVVGQPEIVNEKYTGDARGFIFIVLPLEHDSYIAKGFNSYSLEFLRVGRDAAISLARPNIKVVVGKRQTFLGSQLFNFSNVSCQFKKGEEFQDSLSGFDKVLNDYYYDKELFGPFVKTPPIQRIDLSGGSGNPSGLLGINNMRLTVSNNSLLEGREGSKDIRTRNYSDWNNENQIRDYDSLSITHTIENPLTEQFSVSITVDALSDTTETSFKSVKGVGDLEAGAKIPSVVSFQIETGKISDGVKSQVKRFTYIVAGLIEGGAIVDLGADYEDPKGTVKGSIKLIATDGETLENYFNTPFNLPPLEEGEDPTRTKRYVKVFKLSAETNSVLIAKSISLGKITEIINERISYPFSAISGIKIDARGMSSVPQRSYDCRLKRVKIPSNYFPVNGLTGTDKRYVKSAKNYTQSVPLYIGDWNGVFIDGWTDNPAWILYDLLTSKRYGLGSYIDESQINKWELYKIARFCDAVDDNGFFIGVSDGVGGLEPRYSCNIVFREQTKVYDAINIIANLFRGVVFFGGSEIHFLDDRPRVPIALFSNTNVKDGVFNYGNTRRDQQFNTVEVVFLDRFDNYSTKIEYIQDEADIRKRGVFKTTINTSGVTSRAMARRIGQHIIYQTIKENQSVTFTAGLESLLCRPGDLVVVEDEMKTRSSNYGRVLSIDQDEKIIRIDNSFLTGDFTGLITLYSPTGYATSEDLTNVAERNRGRVNEFEITGDFMGLPQFSELRGLYKFSGYTAGYPQNEEEDFNGPEQFPLYTGVSVANGSPLFYYYNTGASGFVFSLGLPFQNDNQFDKIITNTGLAFGVEIAPVFSDEISRFVGFEYDSAQPDKRSTEISGQLSGAIVWDSSRSPLTRGILDEEINIYNIAQITKIAITGFDNLDYGSNLYLDSGDPNINLLSIVKRGSPYRLERKNSSDQIYKILSIREENQNEYSVTATKYDTGKFVEIEKFITQDFLPDTFYRGPITVGNVDVRELNSPFVNQFTSTNITPTGFSLSGSWDNVDGATGYLLQLSNNLSSEFFEEVTSDTFFEAPALRGLGNWNLQVSALGNGSSRINSLPSKTGLFVAYQSNDQEINTLTRPAVVSFTLE